MGFQKPATADHHEKMDGKCAKPVAMPIVSTDAATGVISISCGWAKQHRRRKVREDSAERHLQRQHGGRGMWL